MQVDGHIAECTAPLAHRRIEMWVRYGDGCHSAMSGYLFDGGIIEVGHQIPEDVALRRLQEMRSLPDAEFRCGGDGRYPWRDLSKHVCVLAVLIFQRRPLLASGIHILSVILADHAGRWRSRALGILRATSDADILLGSHCTL